MVNGLGEAAFLLTEKGLAGAASAAGLIEKGDWGGEGAGSGLGDRPGAATAKGLIGNAGAGGGASGAAIWKGEDAGAD